MKHKRVEFQIDLHYSSVRVLVSVFIDGERRVHKMFFDENGNIDLAFVLRAIAKVQTRHSAPLPTRISTTTNRKSILFTYEMPLIEGV